MDSEEVEIIVKICAGIVLIILLIVWLIPGILSTHPIDVFAGALQDPLFPIGLFLLIIFTIIIGLAYYKPWPDAGGARARP
jgi:hypothetical protein